MSENPKVTLLFNAGKKDEKAVQFITRTPSNRVRKEIAALQLEHNNFSTKLAAEIRRQADYVMQVEGGKLENHEIDLEKVHYENAKIMPLRAELEDANVQFLIKTMKAIINFDRLSESKPRLSDAELELLDDDEFWDEQDLDQLRSEQLKFFRRLGI